MTNPKPLKILCLPGYFTNKEFMEFQMRNFRKYFKNILEFVIIDPPFEFSEYELLQMDETLSKFCKKTKTKALNWWTYQNINEGNTKFEKFLNKALDFLIDYLKNTEKYDGFFGFSQGGSLLDYLFFQAAKGNTKIPLEKMPKFAVISSPNYMGFQGDLVSWKRLKIPVCFLLGEIDYFFIRSMFMTMLYEKPLVIFHKEGHKIPNLDDWQVKVLKDFMINFRENRGKL